MFFYAIFVERKLSLIMKRNFFIVLFALCALCAMKAQDNALGIRLTSGAEFTYQRSLTPSDRLEFNLGWGWNTTSVTGYYQWVNYITDGLKWYIGPGAGLGLFKSTSTLGVGGIVGLEYNFDVPLQVSLDWRPMINLGDTHDTNYGSTNIGLSFRYKF